ncbi:MAG: energy transducer TonB [Prevotellaceae bacterium]|jgi:TonB family protein|nr:energy transducer TonB [Prevotellaceae bacterium]
MKLKYVLFWAAMAVLPLVSTAQVNDTVNVEHPLFRSEAQVQDSVSDWMFEFVEKMPRFKGGQTALTNFLQENILYPKQAIDACIQGQVVVNFVVSPDGSIDRIKIVKPVHSSLDKEAIRVVKLTSGMWMPGEQDGKKVNVYFNLPIKFKLQ